MQFNVGSRAFFNDIEGFTSKDTDVVIFENNPKSYDFYMQKSRNNIDVFYWNVVNVLSYDYNKNPMAAGKLLIPQIINYLGLTYDDIINILDEFIPKLSARHSYQGKILEFYKLNKSMILTSEQLNEVYNIYLTNKESK